MFSSDFREISKQGAPDRAERLFRASLSAYSSLEHPTRAETKQLEDLALPLYATVSADGLRFAAAILSESIAPPPQLVRMLVQERVQICAPLLLRSTTLTDGDLIHLIATKGIAHARVIARRKNLNPAIGALIRQIELRQTEGVDTAPANTREKSIRTTAVPAGPTVDGTAEAVRSELRGMMAPSRVTTSGVEPFHVYQRLRAAVLSGDRNQLIAVLSQSLDIDLETSKGLLSPGATDLLVSALRALALTAEQAVLVIACSVPSHFARADAGREILALFTRQDIAAARQTVAQFSQDDSVTVRLAREVSRAALARSA